VKPLTAIWVWLATAIVACPSAAFAQSVPTADDRTRMVVAFAAGGAVDQIARIIANNVRNTTIVVENRGGGGGDIAMNLVAKAPPDGKTVLLHTSSHVINPTLRGKADEVSQAFEPIARVGAVKFVLVVRKDLPAQTLQELIALGRSGAKLSYGSTGPGTALHIAGEMLNQAGGFQAVHVPYRGLNPGFIDLVAGNIDFMITSVIGVLQYVQTGQIRALAVFEAERSAQLPDVPTTAELGFKELTLSNWYGLFAPAGISAEKLAQLEGMFVSTLKSPQVNDQLSRLGVDGVQSHEEFKRSVNADFARWPAILKKMTIKAE
jgi:tripartite-type tricarboxylate transporter receptor subunit TctC